MHFFQVLPILLHILFAFNCHLSVSKPSSGEVSTNNSSPLLPAHSASTSVRQLAQSAPYAIGSNSNPINRNVIFRLAINQIPKQEANTSQNNNFDRNSDQESWTFVDQNGGLVSKRINFNLKRLLETLNNNNYTSEIKFDDPDSGLVNLTVSSFRDNANPIDELLLEELISESNWGPNGGSGSNSVMKDNHRYESRQQLRSKPLPGNEAITSPPIRGAIEVVAENYTVRRIAEEANVFAIRLIHRLNIEKLGMHNVIQPPFAVYQGLSLLLSGAMGETAKELDKVLLGSQSPYENVRLTHDQDRVRLLASLGDVIHQLQYSSTHHLRSMQTQSDNITGNHFDSLSSNAYAGGTQQQHLITANNLLFSPAAYEISNEFKNSLNTYYNNTVLTKVEIGSTESVQIINSWIRRATIGIIPSVINRKDTFDEFNVMALLCTSWLSQEWKDRFYKISSPLRSSIRLKGTGRQLIFGREQEPLLEFVDDNKQSHFVEYIKSRPTKNIHHYHSILNGQAVDVVVVPFQDSNHRMIMITPITGVSSANNFTPQTPLDHVNNINAAQLSSNANEKSNTSSPHQAAHPPDTSALSRLIALFAGNPRKGMRALWNIIAPDIITKQTLHNIQMARQKNITVDERVIEIIPPLVQLSIPIISTEADSTISAALNHIGIVNSFDPGQANFIGINGHPFNYYKLHLSNVISKTNFKLNERGINYDKTIKTLEAMRIYPERRQQQQQENQNQAKAITIETADETLTLELVDEVKLNKPFMYLVCDIKTKLILYTGILRNPTPERN